MPDWDVVIIGGGAAGLTAAATVAGAGRSCLVIDRMGGGGELMNLGPLQDLEEDLTGPDLMARLLDAAITAGAEPGITAVTALTPDPTGWRIGTDDENHTARAVILAIGLAPGTLGLDSETAFDGQGLSHCAACDGPLYRGEPVVIAGAGRWAQQEARDLATIASHVTLVTQGEPAPAVECVAVIQGSIAALHGSPGLDAITIHTEATGEPQRLPTNIVFVQTGRRPAADFAPATLARDPDGRLITDAALRCNLPGLFAVGDCRSGSPRTLAGAMDEGRRAALAAIAPLGKRSE